MEIKDLKDRIAKKQEQIKKIEKRIAKWENAKSIEAFIKEYSHYIRNGYTKPVKTLDDFAQAFKDHFINDEYHPYTEEDFIKWYGNEYDWTNDKYNGWVESCNSEIRRANRDLEDAQVTLKKYENMLAVEEQKSNTLENDRVDVIWNFLLQYKDRVKEYIRDNLKWVKEYHRLNSLYCDLHNNGYSHTMMVDGKRVYEPEYAQKMKEVSAQEKQAKGQIHPYTEMTYTKDYVTNTYSIKEDKLEELLMKDITARYFKLIDQITKYVGKIKDASNLSIGKKGDLNGYVVGEDGKARVETIGAAGYNIQVFHYRTLVHKIN